LAVEKKIYQLKKVLQFCTIHIIPLYLEKITASTSANIATCNILQQKSSVQKFKVKKNIVCINSQL
jgi:hypothetical protein